jgi:hypothetical protein
MEASYELETISARRHSQTEVKEEFTFFTYYPTSWPCQPAKFNNKHLI